MTKSIFEKPATSQNDAMLIVQKTVLHDLNGQLSPWQQCHAQEWQQAFACVQNHLIKFGASTGGVVQVNGDPFLRMKGNETKLICDYETLLKAVRCVVNGLMFYEQPVQPLFARDVAEALERHLMKLENSSVHWCKPAGAKVSWEPPRLTWPNDANLSYVVQNGYSEGSLVIVGNTPTRGFGAYQPLLVCKFLCGYKRAFGEAREVMEFLEPMNPATLRETCQALQTD